jgi:hypothetical protein
MPTPETAKSELAWLLADYRAAKSDPPARIVSHPHQTEGEMMSDDEIEEFIKDSIATLRILSDHKSARYAEIYDTFCLDLRYLTDLGRMSEDDYTDLTSPENLHF